MKMLRVTGFLHRWNCCSDWAGVWDTVALAALSGFMSAWCWGIRNRSIVQPDFSYTERLWHVPVSLLAIAGILLYLLNGSSS